MTTTDTGPTRDLLYGHYVATLTSFRDKFYPARSLEWVAGWHDGAAADRSKRDQGDADYDAGWYRGYVTGCDRMAEDSGTGIPENNRDYWDHLPVPSGEME